MPILSQISRKRKIKYFLDKIPKTTKILEIGSGDGWVGDYLRNNGYSHYTGIDLFPPADIIGDINNWGKLPLQESYYDYIIAFEIFEHIDCIEACYSLLKKNGKLLITTPLPHMDWSLNILEFLKLNQKRSSPHNNLIYLKHIEGFSKYNIKIIAFLSQWGIITK